MNLHRILSTAAVATGAVLLSVGIQALAYTAPTSAPTTVDADAPLNVGTSAQTKNGFLGATKVTTSGTNGFCINLTCITSWPALSLTAGSGITLSTTPITRDSVGTIGVDSTVLRTSGSGQTKSDLLTLSGGLTVSAGLSTLQTVKIQGGAPSANAVLTSDASGNATWTKLSAKCGANPKCTSLPDGTIIQWGYRAADNGVGRTTTSGLAYRTIVMPVAYSSSAPTGFIISVNTFGSVFDVASQNCTPGATADTTNSFRIVTDANCDGVGFMWQVVGK
jgi:hypothetical protein